VFHGGAGVEEPEERHANRHPGSLAICTVLSILVGLVLTGW